MNGDVSGYIGKSEVFGGVATKRFDDLNDRQKADAEKYINEIGIAAIYDNLVAQSEVINRVARVLDGFESSDIDLQFDPQTGKTTMYVRDKELPSASLILPAITWEDRRKVLSVVVDDADEETVVWDKDYVRSVASTEP